MDWDWDYSSAYRLTRDPRKGGLQNIKICPLCGPFFVFLNTFKQVWVFRKTKKLADAGF